MNVRQQMTEINVDIAVIGAGPGGISAAVSAAREGMKVALVERQGYPGGNLATGLPMLGFLDAEGRQVTGGFAQEFIDRLQDMDGTYGHRRCPFHNSVTVINPSYARILCSSLIRETGILPLLHCEATELMAEGNDIKAVVVTGKGQRVKINAKVFIDATGDGDVAYMAGAGYEKGQPETGDMQPSTLMFDIGGIVFDEFFDYIEKHPEELPYGTGLDHISQGYDHDFFRNSPNHVFFGLNSLISRLADEGSNPLNRDTLIYIRQPFENHAVINSIRLPDSDGTDILKLTNSELDGHLQILPIIEMLREHVPGFENCYLSSINPSMGVRETRRITGLKTLTEADAVSGRVPSDSICLGAYIIDIHSARDASTYIVKLKEPYGIPYGCLVSSDLDNMMMSGRCISVDAVAFGSTRVMPTCMAVGEAVGIGAAIAISENLKPGDVSAGMIRRRLIENGAILSI